MNEERDRPPKPKSFKIPMILMLFGMVIMVWSLLNDEGGSATNCEEGIDQVTRLNLKNVSMEGFHELMTGELCEGFNDMEVRQKNPKLFEEYDQWLYDQGEKNGIQIRT